MRDLKVFAGDLASDLMRIFGRGVLVAMAGLGVLFLGFLFAVGNLVYPYRPVVVHEYRALPMEVCPGGDVVVEIDWEVRDDLRALDVVYAWSERESSASVFGGEAEFEDFEAMPRGVFRSPFIRLAPTEPGLWKLETSYDVFGTRLGLPVRQDLDDVTSEDFVKVLEANDEKCERSL